MAALQHDRKANGQARKGQGLRWLVTGWRTKTIELTAGHQVSPLDHGLSDGTLWRVERITDSTEYSPGQMLDKKQVDRLCDSRHWRVVITQSANEPRL